MESKKEDSLTEPLQGRMELVPMRPMRRVSDVAVTDGGGSLSDFTRIVSRHRWKLLAFIGIALAASIVVQITVPKLYEATALVKVDRHQSTVVTEPESQPAGQADDMDQIMTTEIELAQSDPVLRPVAERYNLLDVEKQTRFLNAAEKIRLWQSPIELKKLKVTRPPNTYLLRIRYRANDPQLAAEVANAVAQSLVVHANDTAAQSMNQTNGIVAGSLASLREKMDKSNHDLADYEKQLGMIDPQQRITVLNSQLVQLNTELTSAQTERVTREATLRLLNHSDTLATAQALDALRTTPDTSLNEAVTRLDAARQQFAAARSYYGETHPEYAKAKQQVEELTRQLNEMVANARDRANAAFQHAVSRQNQLRGLVAATKVEVDSLQAKDQQYEQLRSRAESDNKLYESLISQSLLTGINKQFDSASLQVFAAARPPEQQIFPRMIIDLPVALALSILLGVLAVVVVNAFDDSLSGTEGIAEHLPVDVLALVPNAKRLPAIKGPPAPSLERKSLTRAMRSTARYAEGIWTLRSALSLVMANGSLRTVAVTSALRGEGKSATVSQLAHALAQVGKKVLIVDADMRCPTLHKTFGVPQTPGLSDILEGKQVHNDGIIPLYPPGLYLLTAGPISHRSADLVSIGLSQVLTRVSREFDLTLIDCPPVHQAAEAQEIAAMVDGVLVLTKARGTSGKLVSSALFSLQRARARVIGIVLNHVHDSDFSGYKYYAAEDNRRRIASIGA